MHSGGVPHWIVANNGWDALHPRDIAGYAFLSERWSNVGVASYYGHTYIIVTRHMPAPFSPSQVIELDCSIDQT